MTSFRVTLPMPPSMRQKKGRAEARKAWRERATNTVRIAAANNALDHGKYFVRCVFSGHFEGKRRDLYNLTDLLADVVFGALKADDSWAWEKSEKKVHFEGGAEYVTVSISPYRG